MIGKLLRQFFFSNPKRANWFLTHMPAGFFEKQGKKQALATFKDTVAVTPAYREFLKEHGVKPETITNFDEFTKVPLIDKANYIKKYPLADRVKGGSLINTYAISTSSGSTGIPTYWPRTPDQDNAIPPAMDLVCSQFYQMDTVPTLTLMTLALGTWAAGEMAGAGMRKVAEKRPFAVVSPGLDSDNTLRMIRDLNPHFKQILVCGYAPFVKKIIEDGAAEGINWSELNTKLLMGGEGITETWRSYIGGKLGLSEDDCSSILNLFATAEGGILGFETPISIYIRKKIETDKALSQELFGDLKPISLTQFIPLGWYIEEVDGEIVITKTGGTPLVRYNIHDRGGVFSFNKVMEKVFPNKEDRAKFPYDIWNIPFFYTFGRSDCIQVGGANVYVENIQAILSEHFFVDKMTGAFKVGSFFDEQQNQRFELKLELTTGVTITEELQKEVTDKLVHRLRAINPEYESSFKAETDENFMIPKIELCQFQDPRYFVDNKIKNKYFLR